MSLAEPAGKVQGKAVPAAKGAAGTAARPAAATKAAIRKAIFTAHLWVGLALSVWFVLLGLTGAALVFKPHADTLLNPKLMTSRPATPGAQMVTPDAALASAQATYPQTAFKRLGFPLSANGVYELRYGKEKQEREVFVNAYTGAVQGERSRRASVMHVVLELHKALLLRDLGKQLNGIGALLLVGLIATGIYLWWPANAKQWPQRLKVKTGASTKRLLFDLHNAFGIYTLPVLLLVSATGAVFIYEKPVERGVYAMTGTPMPAEKHEMHESKEAGKGEKKAKKEPKEARPVELQVSLAQLIAASEAEAPGTHLKHIDLPDQPGKPVRVHRERRTGAWVNNKMKVQFDSTTGAVLKVEDERKDPLAKRIMRWNGPLHEGKIAGPVTQWLYLLIALIVPLGLTVTGTMKWWQTRQSRLKNRTKHAGKAPAPGAA